MLRFSWFLIYLVLNNLLNQIEVRIQKQKKLQAF